MGLVQHLGRVSLAAFVVGLFALILPAPAAADILAGQREEARPAQPAARPVSPPRRDNGSVKRRTRPAQTPPADKPNTPAR